MKSLKNRRISCIILVAVIVLVLLNAPMAKAEIVRYYERDYYDVESYDFSGNKHFSLKAELTIDTEADGSWIIGKNYTFQTVVWLTYLNTSIYHPPWYTVIFRLTKLELSGDAYTYPTPYNISEHSFDLPKSVQFILTASTREGFGYLDNSQAKMYLEIRFNVDSPQRNITDYELGGLIEGTNSQQGKTIYINTRTPAQAEADAVFRLFVPVALVVLVALNTALILAVIFLGRKLRKSSR